MHSLELPEALAVADVCKSWCCAAIAAGVPRSCTPWLMSWSDKPPHELEYDVLLNNCKWQRPMGCEFHDLVNGHKTYEVNLPQVAWVGASHGWLAAADNLSNLLLYNPFTFTTIPLPPITDLGCVEAVYDSEGSIVRYRLGKHKESDAKFLGVWFYQKLVLSCAPSLGGDYVAMIIHSSANRVSFASAIEGRWRLASTITQGSGDRYADCVYHKGRFYTLTMYGVLEMLDLDNPCEPRKEIFFTERNTENPLVFLRFLVSTPWGDLLQIKFSRRVHRTKRLELRLCKIEVENNRLVRLRSAVAAAALREHAIFVGQNHSVCLPIRDFPELRSSCVYFTTPCLCNDDHFPSRREGWKGVGIYDLQNQIFEDVFPSCERGYSTYLPISEVWITPSPGL